MLHLIRKEFADLPLYLEAETTPSAQQFYEKMGFERVGLLDFKGCLKPLPCMMLYPEVRSLLDQSPKPHHIINGQAVVLPKEALTHSVTPTPPTLSA